MEEGWNFTFKEIIGKTIANVSLDKSSDHIEFTFTDGSRKAYSVEGDCCSQSWIEHLEMPNDVVGAVILSVEDGDSVPWDNHECVPYDWETRAEGCGHDVLCVYKTSFNTNRGSIVLEYRNDSNGYYGGSLVDADPLPQTVYRF